MTEPWWTQGATRSAPTDPTGADAGDALRLVAEDPGAVRAAVAERIPGFTPDWTDHGPGDAGVALVRLFGLEVSPVLARVNRLPDRAAVEHLRTAAIERRPARPAQVTLQVTLSSGATESVLVPAGYQLSTDPADDSDQRVVFETVRPVSAAPAVIDVAFNETGGRSVQLDLERRWSPFGSANRPGSALWLGLAGDAAPSGELSVGFQASTTDGAPPPATSGGTSPAAIPPPPLLRWELLDGGRLVPLDVLRDETRSLQQGGIVDLRLPRSWASGQPASLQAPPARRWLRVGLVHGSYTEPPMMDAVRLNVVPAVAARTVRDEALDRLPEAPGDRRVRMQLSERPIVPGSAEIEVDPVAADVFGTGEETGQPTRWTEVDELAGQGPMAQVFTLDPETGIIEFGDGVDGRAVPDGFRNVRATRYQVGGGRAGAIEAEAGPAPLRSLPFVAGVDNPQPATGGVDAEPQADAVRRGPAQLRARDRAVAPADYGLLAQEASGAEVARAYAVPGLHPLYAGAPIPGLVGVFVIPPTTSDGPPIADAETLQAVADHLVAEAAPVGIQVVAAAAQFHEVRVEARVQLSTDVDPGTGIGFVLSTLDRYLDPLTGGEAGDGWPPGGTLRVVPTIRQLLAQIPALRAVPQLNFVVDGVRFPPCDDVTIDANALVWPSGHDIVPVDGEGSS